VATPGFCNRGGSEVWVYRGSRVRSTPVPVVLSVYQRGSLLDGLAMYLSCDAKKFPDNECTHILHNFRTSTHRGEASTPSPWRHHWDGCACMSKDGNAVGRSDLDPRSTATGTSAGFWLGGSMPPCRMRRIFFENLTTKWCILKYIRINVWSA